MDDSKQKLSLIDSIHNEDLISQKNEFSNLKDIDSDSEHEISITIDVDKNTFVNKRNPQSSAVDGIEPKPVDMYSEPFYKNMLIYDLDPVSIDDRPWNKPGADITDYFNYGFVEETWNIYRDRQRKIRQESAKLQRDVSLMGGSHGQMLGENSMPGIMVLNSESTLLSSQLHPESSSNSLFMPLMNQPPTSAGSVQPTQQIPAFFPGHSIPPNYFMPPRFGMRGIPPQFQRPVVLNDRNFRFPVKQEPLTTPDEGKSKNESPEKTSRIREKKSDKRSSRRRSRSDSSEKVKKKKRKRSRSSSRDKSKRRNRTRR